MAICVIESAQQAPEVGSIPLPSPNNNGATLSQLNRSSSPRLERELGVAWHLRVPEDGNAQRLTTAVFSSPVTSKARQIKANIRVKVEHARPHESLLS